MHGGSGVGGANSTTDVWSNAFNAAGIATFNVDGHSARGITTLAEGQRLSAYVRVQDAFGALEALAKHPLIDAKKIAIMGFSHGGPSAIFSNVVRFQKKDSDVKFAAHISMYGICGDHCGAKMTRRVRCWYCMVQPTTGIRRRPARNMLIG